MNFNFNFFGSENKTNPIDINSAIFKSNQLTIERVKGYKKQGLKVNLFIGRTPNEPLPQKDDALWISLSIEREPASLNCTKDYNLHLIINCNNKEEMKTIQGVFDRVVVDLSTKKFFKHLPYIYDAVQPGGDLLIEMDSGCLKYPSEIEEEILLLKASNTYRKKTDIFIAKFFKEKLDIDLDLKKIQCHIAQDPQVASQEARIKELPEYKKWDARQKQREWPCGALLPFFKDLAEAEGIINPEDLLWAKQKDDERKTRTEEMEQFFGEVELRHEKFPYENQYDYKGQNPTEYFHAHGKKAIVK